MITTYVSIDGDDVGKLITASYLDNDVEQLKRINTLVNDKTKEIEALLRDIDFSIIFRAADGVAAVRYSATELQHGNIFMRISTLASPELTFSVGVGATLRQSYIALLKAKSSGKARVCQFEEMAKDG